MKLKDWVILLIVALLLSAFVFVPGLKTAYENLNATHGMWMSFAKFALLATFGESLALRIKTGFYNRPGFGLLPRALVWGFLGLTIKMAFVIFANGTPVLLAYLGFEEALKALPSGLSWAAFFTAFSISTAMNLTYAPVMMTIHKITDTHISKTGGSLRGLFSPINIRQIFRHLDWDTQWNFVFKKTIPFFWIPAHTITFLLPADYQILFAALLGVALGVILSFATLKNVKP
ncbi:MAG: hypothetical protein PF694_07535 [Bacteroidetes bacterium]|jgi:hypothetical protein|nr:hypothetical protein [Bacteroidota bacterium]